MLRQFTIYLVTLAMLVACGKKNSPSRPKLVAKTPQGKVDVPVKSIPPPGTHEPEGPVVAPKPTPTSALDTALFRKSVQATRDGKKSLVWTVNAPAGSPFNSQKYCGQIVIVDPNDKRDAASWAVVDIVKGHCYYNTTVANPENVVATLFYDSLSDSNGTYTYYLYAYDAAKDDDVYAGEMELSSQAISEEEAELNLGTFTQFLNGDYTDILDSAFGKALQQAVK